MEDLTSERIYVDFNKVDDRGYHPATSGTARGIERLGLRLVEGMAVGVYSDDLDDNLERDYLLAEAVAVYDPVTRSWAFDVDPATIRHESDERRRNT